MRALNAMGTLFRGFSSGLMFSAAMGILVALLISFTSVFGDSDLGIIAGIVVSFIQIAPLVVLVTIFYTVVIGMPLAAILRALRLFGLIPLAVVGALSGYAVALWQWPMTEPILFAVCGALASASFWFGCRLAEKNRES